MPEFILDKGDGAEWFDSLDEFTQGYVEAMFFTSTATADDGDLEHTNVGELSHEAREAIYAACRAFQEANREDLDEALDSGGINGYDETQAGRDFWYSRNYHGAGYFDRELGDVGDKLQNAAHRIDGCDVYRGDDGKLYLA